MLPEFASALASPALLASIAACCVTTAGIWAIRRHEAWARRWIVCFMAFAAGVLISVSLLHVAPTAVTMTPAASRWLLGGYLATYAFDRFLTANVCDRPDRRDYAIGLVPLMGIGLHSAIDGAVYAVAFGVSDYTGALAAVGMVLHEFPEGVVTYMLMRRGGFGVRAATMGAFGAAALTTPLGTAAALPLVAALDAPTLGALLAFSAGALLYVGATHLLPRAEQEGSRYSLIALGAGVTVALGIVLTHP